MNGGTTKESISVDQMQSSGNDERQHLLHQGVRPQPPVPVPTPPKDRFYLAYMILFLHGIGHLLPWNMFITAHEYFVEKFSCPGGSSSSSCASFIKDSFENYFSIAAMFPTVIVTAINIYVQSKVRFQLRMLVSLSMMLALFVVTAALVKIDTNKNVDLFFAGTLITIALLSVSGGLFQSSTFGFAGILPQKYTVAVLSGQACAGLFASLARIISSVATEDILWSAFGYFISAIVVILICLATFFVLINQPFVKYYLSFTSVRTIQERSAQQEIRRGERISVPFWKIAYDISVYAVSVCLVFLVTLSLFPAVCSSIKSTVKYPDESIWTGKLFDALVCFLIFNSSDLAGRCLANWSIIMTGRWRFVLLALTISRFIFVPLLLLCNVQPRSEHFPVIFNNDVWPVLFVTALGLSNGFLASLSMVSAPQSVKEEYRETASTIMSFFLCFGLLLGAAVSFLYTYLIKIDSKS